VLEQAARRGVLPRKAAVDLALARVQQAMRWRRWSIF
jgi:glutamate dehydrogenase (NAD(P)+)